MNKEQMDKYGYELMIKNNSDEAVKNLLLKDKEIDRLNSIINTIEQFITNNSKDCEIEEYHVYMTIWHLLQALKEDE